MVTQPGTSESVDLFARWVGGTGAATALVSLVVSFFGLDRRGMWRRRHASIEGIRPALDEIDQQVDPAAIPQAMLTLWGVGVQLALDDIATREGSIPYRRFRRQLRAVHQELVIVRGMQQPDEAAVKSGEGITMTIEQRAGLNRARAALDELRKMKQKAAQRGVV